MESCAVLVGNGLSLALRDSFSQLRRWNPSNPIGWWGTRRFSGQNQSLEALFPKASQSLKELRSSDPSYSDFDIIKLAYEQANVSRDLSVIVELRHLLVRSYSHYAMIARKYNTSTASPWTKFLQSIATSIEVAISFNYDLNLEAMLGMVRPVWRTVISDSDTVFVNGKTTNSENLSGIPLFKPHGSIDYDANELIFGKGSAKYPMTSYMEKLEVPMRLIPTANLLHPRNSAEIVLPGEASTIRDYQWIETGYRRIAQIAPKVSKLYIVGLSYSSVDQPEISRILDSFDPSITVIYANPSPSPELADKLNSTFREYVPWESGPGS